MTGCIINGQACTVNANCCSGNCSAGVCAGGTDRCGVGNNCHIYEEATCCRLGPNTAECCILAGYEKGTYGTVCCDGTTDIYGLGLLCGLSTIGQCCVTNAHCQSGFCNYGTCMTAPVTK